jgi:hypothetical protein
MPNPRPTLLSIPLAHVHAHVQRTNAHDVYNARHACMRTKQANATMSIPMSNYSAGATVFASFTTANPGEYEIFTAVGRPGEPIAQDQPEANGVAVHRVTTTDFKTSATPCSSHLPLPSSQLRCCVTVPLTQSCLLAPLGGTSWFLIYLLLPRLLAQG